MTTHTTRKLAEGWRIELVIGETSKEYPDNFVYETHEVATLSEAKSLAQKLMPRDLHGEIRLTPFTTDDYGREYDTDSEQWVYGA